MSEENEENEEIWKSIKGYEERYVVSNEGKVRNVVSGRILKCPILSGYYSILLYKKNYKRKSFHIHRLVAEHFVTNDNPKINIVVDHINENKLNNNATNLRWTTHSENTKHYHAKHERINPVMQYDKNGNFIKKWDNVSQILDEHKNYRGPRIYYSLNHKNKMAYNYIWEYENYNNIPVVLKDDEIFKNIGNFDGHDFSKYEISNYGNLRSLYTNRMMSQNLSEGGYYISKLMDIKTNERIGISFHRLVAFKFVKGKSKERNYVNHINEIKTDNYYKNLEWVSFRENIEHSLGKKVNQIDPKTNKIINTFKTINKACEYLGLSHEGMCTCISYCCKGKHKLSYGFKWEYADDDQKVNEIKISLEQIKKQNQKEGEIWKNVIGYGDKYEISNLGRVRTNVYKRFLNPYIEKNYYSLRFRKNNKAKRHRVHRLVAIHFIENPNQKKIVRHIDGNKSNNKASNLKWI